MTILYLHGFRSAPASAKARMLAENMAQRGLSADWICPQLPASPRQAAELALQHARQADSSDLTVIGSSLGGYYATWLAEQTGCRAVLLNPAVYAPRDLATQVGAHRAFHEDQPFIFLPEYVDELRDLWVPDITRPDRYFLIAATGDEVLDWREMTARYAACRQLIVQGSDHGLSDFQMLMPEVLAFAGLPAAPRA